MDRGVQAIVETVEQAVEQADPGADLTFEADGARVQATFRGDLGPEFEATLAGELERIATSRQDLRKLIGATTHVVDRGEWVEVPGGKVDG